MDTGYEHLRGLLGGAMATQTVGLAAELGLADTVAAGGALADIAAAHQVAPDRMVRLLRALVSLGCATEPEPETFALTTSGALLRTDGPASMNAFAQLCADEVTLRSWLGLGESLRTGSPAFDAVFGCPAFEYYADRPQDSARFNRAMSDTTSMCAQELPRHYDFSRFTTIVDVGGGNGTLLAGILAAAPGARGVLFDREAGRAEAATVLERAGVGARCEIVAGDFRDGVPAGADLYVIKSVLHNWADEDAVTLLRNCRTAMRPGGRVLILDPLLPDTATPATSSANPYLMDLHMLVVAGGKERTEAQFRAVCERAGLAVTAVGASVGDLTVVEAAVRR